MPYFNKFNEPCITYGQMNLLFTIRVLWRELATWTRAYMVNTVYGLEVAEEVFNRLYRIPEDFGNILKNFFGYDNSVKFVQLLSQQIVLFRSLLEEMIAGDQEKTNDTIRQLYQLANERAALMHEINPYWDETEVRNAINAFYQYTIDEAFAILSQDFSKDINLYDRLLHHADTMGDHFTQGLFQYMTLTAQNNCCRISR
ncbi:MAG: hypothetical protein K0R19_1831 [Bacillota bacterium]|nr:hypothetical protein [Bacillota bacterium]